MKLVLDSSVCFKWVVPELYTDKALILRNDSNKSIVELIAPDIFPIEIAHAITRAERVKRITPAQGALALADVMSTLPQLFPYIPLLARSYEISSQMRIGVYDCLYVALAERETCDLVTADHRLIKNLQPQFPFIVPLSTMP
jgi:predicted nucleic acid-binding protein